MSAKRYKIEIIDNQIGNYFQMNLFVWKRKNWWSKEDWNIEFRHILGKRYMCPEIHKGKITAEGMFQRDVKKELEREGIEEIHRIQILPPVK
jgi:hypothetical protein